MNYTLNILKEYHNDIIDVIRKEKQLNIEDFTKQYLNMKLLNPNILPNIDIAVERIQKAISNNEKILISGDYDCDGITATTIMVIGLKTLTTNVDWIIPNRFKDGYGINKRIVDKAIEDKVDLIITVDNGISSHEAIHYAKDNNIDVIVTDHHRKLQKDLPTDITVDPFIDDNYPFAEICGCYVAYKLLRMLIPNLTKLSIHSEIVALTTFATIADAMPLTYENRKIVQLGLDIINTEFLGYGVEAFLKNIQYVEKGYINSQTIGFSVAPCINAVGRIEGDVSEVVQLFLCDDEVEANRLAKKIVKYNDIRKKYQTEFLSTIVVDDTDDIIYQVVENVPAGILGIIAGQISEKYQKPCFCLIKLDNGYAGSGRSIGGYDISNLININKECCVGGGHKGAVGITIYDLEKFKLSSAENYKQWLEENSLSTEKTLNVLCELNFSDITEELLDKLQSLQPFGRENEEPRFCTKNVLVATSKIIGKTNNTVKLKLQQDCDFADAIGFNAVKDKFVSVNEENIDLVYTLSYNYFRGIKTIQLTLVDVRKHE